MSKLTYLIALWGGSADQLMKPLQKAQNKAARAVTKLDWNTPVRTLLHQCGWLSVGQLVFFHSVVQIYKTIVTTYPKYIYSKLSTQFPYNTRLAESDSVRMGPEFKSKLELTEKSFMNRATVSFNLLPPELRKISKLEEFKEKLKVWVLGNVKI